MTTTGYFDWHELQSRDLAKAAAFYEKLFGWTTKEIRVGPSGEPYRLCTLDGHEIAGIAMSKAPAQVPAYWLAYLTVGDVDAAAAEAKSLGARVIREPADIAGLARSAIVADPRGAVFALRGPRAPQLGSPAPREGTIVWSDLLTDDASAAAAFYAKLCGHSVEELDMGPVGTYRILKQGDQRIAGVMKHPENIRPHWLPYFAVHDVDEITRRALDLGASLYLPARDIPGFGRFSAIDDPTGAGVCLLRAETNGNDGVPR
jgi:predicted enzyme related to lactoylglutathione lyase